MKLGVKRTAAIASLLGLLAIGAAPFLWVKADTVIPGVRINGISVGGKTKAELLSILDEKNRRMSEEKLVLQRDSVHEEWTFKELNVHYDEKSLDKVMERGRKDSLPRQWLTRWRTILQGKSFYITAVYDGKSVQEKAASLQEKYRKPAENPKPRFQGDGTVTFSPGRPFLKINDKALLENVGHSLQSGEGETIEIPVEKETKPVMSDGESRKINTVLGQYTTHFGPDANRSSNIALACEKVSGIYLKPGDHFSYNQATGARSAANGYKEAPVIINGKLEPGSGGGVCQVSSTLFNAALLSGLEITERTCHFSPVSYVPIGRDATVAEGYLDFCMQNHLKNGIYIYAEYEQGAVTLFILGNKEDKPSSVDLSLIKDETLPFKTVYRTDPSQEEKKKVDEGHEGRNVTLRQSAVWADGRQYTDFFESDYEPVDTVITFKDAKDVPAKENTEGA